MKAEVQLLARIPAALKADSIAFAESEKCSLSELVRRALEAYMKDKKEEKLGVAPTYKAAMLRCLDDEDFRKMFLQKLNGESADGLSR